MLRQMLHSEPGRFLVLLFVGVGLWAVAIVGLLLLIAGFLNEPATIPDPFTD